MAKVKSQLHTRSDQATCDGPSIALPTTTVRGVEISAVQIRKIKADLLSGKHPQLSKIARRNGVSVCYIKRLLENDPELKQSYEDALLETAEEIEQAAVDMCLDDGINPIAREKMIEFCLPKMMPQRYGEQAELLSGVGQRVKRIALVPVMPVVEVDANGIPVERKPQGEVIDVPTK